MMAVLAIPECWLCLRENGVGLAELSGGSFVGGEGVAWDSPSSGIACTDSGRWI